MYNLCNIPNLESTNIPPKVAKNQGMYVHCTYIEGFELGFLPYCPKLPKRPKQKNSCSKMWPIDQLYIKLGYPATGADRGITQYAMG